MTPHVSIVMAAKNYARFIAEAIDSVRAQTFTDWELIIVDDGSSDGTPGVVLSYTNDQRIRYYRADRLGQTRAKNLGIGLSRARFLAFLDADDAWLPTKLAKQLALFEAQPTLGVVFCRRNLIDEASQPLEALPSEDPPRGRVLSTIFVQNFVCFSSAVVRRDVFSQVGRFNPEWDLSIDYDLWLRVAQHHTFDYVNESLVNYRTGHGNLSKRLSDRVAIALSIMHRAQRRQNLSGEVDARTVAEGQASTCRTLGYVMRSSEPGIALNWYAKALCWPTRRWASLKGIVATCWIAVRRRRRPGSAENASVNR